MAAAGASRGGRSVTCRWLADFAEIYRMTVNFGSDWFILLAFARWGISATPAAGALQSLGETHGKYP